MIRNLAAALVITLILAGCSSEADPAASEPVSGEPVTVEAVDDAAPAESTSAASDPTGPTPTSSTSTATGVPNSIPTATSCRGDGPPPVGRTDIDPTGNRSALGSIDLLAAPVGSFELPGRPNWVVPYFDAVDECEPHWYVTLDDGSAVIVTSDGTVTEADAAFNPPVTAAGLVTSAYDELGRFADPLLDSRVVEFGPWIAALADPTDRYGHGVLGDRIEAGAIEIVDTRTDERVVIVIDAPTVIEGISPMFVDLDPTDEATPQLLVTLSNADVGAWLALYDLDGTLRAESDPIGRGNRWRNQLGAGQTTPDAVYEIVDVRTPHLDGVVEFFRVDGDRLERTASISGYTNHTIGSRNLDLGILVDADADKLLEVLLPTRDLGALAIIERAGDGATELGRIDLDGSLATNISSQWISGQAWIAVGTSDDRLLVFGDPSVGGQ